MRSTGYRCSSGCSQETAPQDRFADDYALGPPHPSQCAQLRVAALDELSEQGRIETRGDRAGLGARELAGVTINRATLAVVVIGNIDDKRGCCRVVDEVIADPVRLPRFG